MKYKQNLQKNNKKTYCEIQTKHANKYREILLSNKQKTEMQTKLSEILKKSVKYKQSWLLNTKKSYRETQRKLIVKY